MEQFKGSGVKRLVVASTALCMGENSSNVRFIINWGLAQPIPSQTNIKRLEELEETERNHT